MWPVERTERTDPARAYAKGKPGTVQEPFGLPTGRLRQANLEPNGIAPAGRPVSFVADDGDESPETSPRDE